MSARHHVADSSQIAQTRRMALAMAKEAEFTEEVAGALALVVTEAGTNLVKHAGGGEIILRRTRDAAGIAAGIEVLSLDKGPGMANVAECMRDGFSSMSTPGTGLGAIRRMARTFDIYSRPGLGTVLLAVVAGGARKTSTANGVSLGVVSVAKQGETVCGDSWDFHSDGARSMLLLVDGVGHGVDAAQAAADAVRAFQRHLERPPSQIINSLHGALRAGRGAAGAVAEIQHGRQALAFCGVGNVAAVCVSGEQSRHLVSHNGTLGHAVRTITEFAYPWSPDGLLVMASDGIATKWSLSSYPGLEQRHPSVIAGVLFRDFTRGRDDATVAVLREHRP